MNHLTTYIIGFIIVEAILFQPTILLMSIIFKEEDLQKLPLWNSEWFTEVLATIIYVVLFQAIICLIIYILYQVYLWITSTDVGRECYDKTTIDWNRQNDMKCINENWDIKWTDYEWAKKLMWK